MSRRTHGLATIVATLLNAGIACSADFPQRPVRLIMPFAAGGGSDTVGRIVSQHLSELWKQPVVVDSRLGAAGNIAADLAAKAAPDGYTILFNTAALLIAPHLSTGLSFDPAKDFTPITKLGYSPAALLLSTQLKANSVADLITIAKAQPGKLSYGSAGNGSAVHLATELLNLRARIRMEHIPYKGGNLALTDLIAGRIQVLFSPLGPALPMAKAGRVNLIAVTTAQRSPTAPDIPTLSESGVPGYDFSYWWGLFAPSRTPQALVAQINRDTVKVVEAPSTKAQLAGYGVTVATTTLAEFAAEIRNETRIWAEVAKSAGIKPQ